MRRSGRTRGRRWAMGVAAAGVATSVVGVAATQPASISAPLVDLTALIAVGSSTNPSGAGVQDFFGGQFAAPTFTGPSGDDITTVNFLTGLSGINQALQANRDDPRNAVVTSGWGAANASLLLGQLAAKNDPVAKSTTWVLDNNVAAPDGGFGTRYPWFALIGVNPFPTPTDTGAPVIVTAYQYNYNSNAPADLFNGLAHLNSLVAYLYGYQDQKQINLPVDDEGNPTCGSSSCTVMDGDRVAAYVVQKGTTTYVTYTTDQLPLARLIRDFVPFGNEIADRIEPLLRVLVDSAYYGNNPIPADPSQYKPARLFPSLAEIVDTVSKIPAAIQEGFGPRTSTTPAISATAQTVGEETNRVKSSEVKGPTLADADEQSTVKLTQKSDQSEQSEDIETKPGATTKPLTGVVRRSEKTEPGKVSADKPKDDPKPVADEADSAGAAPDDPTRETTPAGDQVHKPDTSDPARHGGGHNRHESAGKSDHGDHSDGDRGKSGTDS